MDLYQMIQEAEAITAIRKAYEKDPTIKLPSFRQIKKDYHLRRITSAIDGYVSNLQALQKLFLSNKETDYEKHFSQFHTQPLEKIPYGYIAQCSEDELFENEILAYSPYQEYQSCIILASPETQARSAVYWEYQDCGRPEGCTRLVRPEFAQEILHNRNYHQSDYAYRLLMRNREPEDTEDIYTLILNTLHNQLITSMAIEGMDHRNLINYGYTPLVRMVKDFTEQNPLLEEELTDLNYLIETIIVEIHSATDDLPQDLLVSILGNLPFYEIADALPDMVFEYKQIKKDQFVESLARTKVHLRKVDQIFADESIFASLIRKILK